MSDPFTTDIGDHSLEHLDSHGSDVSTCRLNILNLHGRQGTGYNITIT